MTTAHRLFVAAALAGLIGGCGDERWVEAEVTIPPGVGSVCVTARGSGAVAYSERYEAGEPGGSVVFIEGDEVSGHVILEATHRRGGRSVARARVDAPFGTGGLPVALSPGSCVAFEPPPGAELATIAGAEALVALDEDGDGIDTLVVDVGDDSQDLGGTPRGVPTLVGGADLDGDCLPELWGMSAGEARAEGRTIAIDGDALTFGDAGTGPRLFVAGPSGVSAVTHDAVRRSLSGAPSRTIVAGDLNGDGIDEVVAGGDSGIEVFFGGEGGPVIAPGATPRGWTATALALGDVDGDGDLDLAVASDAGLGLARNRGDGFLEAASVPSLAPVAVRVGDVNGDCIEDVVALGGDGAASQWIAGGVDGLGAMIALGDDVIDATFAALEDGRPQLVLLRSDGRVEAYAP
ncbi:MAG: VCBS repeat-containing protein [Deltaproteobacteria bacterium]|nr:VCBS repeat-containing protein [Deltaproteobacteria bacterium]